MVVVYEAASPAATVAAGGAAAIAKSLTGTLALAELLPATRSTVVLLMVALSVRGPGAAVGVNCTLTFAEAPAAIAPTLQTTVTGAPDGAAQLPCPALVAVKVAPAAGNVSVNVTPEASSGPLLVMV
jgi:hypothetical protein